MAHAEVKHPYHLVTPSPWPIVGSVGAFLMLGGAVFWMNSGAGKSFGPMAGQPWVFVVGLVLVLYTMAGWWRDVIRESVVLHEHTAVTKLGMRFGMVLFIASEVMFFVAWFWAYFNFKLFPHDASIGAWPPAGIVTLDPWHFPLLNTLILLTSGTTVTWAHHAIQTGDRKGARQGLLLTVLLGLSFTAVQAYEYSHAPFTFGFNHLALVPFKPDDLAHISLAAGAGNFDAIYGSTFFMATGFHGMHVIIGTTFLIVCLFRAMAGQFTPERHFGFEAAAWYWHFVDVVWLFLFICIYVWGAGAITQA
ncbi:MAG TPA: cytochrome c oxidase subunit 3 [Rhizomicrobium sp.]|jgi:cytochrome c oxidase subunit 3